MLPNSIKKISSANPALALTIAALLHFASPARADLRYDCELDDADGRVLATTTHVTTAPQSLNVHLSDGSVIGFARQQHDGFQLYTVDSLDLLTSASTVALFHLQRPQDAEPLQTLNGFNTNGDFRALMAAEPDLIPLADAARARVANKAGTTHEFRQTSESKVGQFAAEFTASNSGPDAGWAMRGFDFAHPVNATGLAGVRAWVKGDGKGEALKFQILDDSGGLQDYYVTINFTGWQQVEISTPALDLLKNTTLSGVNIYYNGMPANNDVTCLVDHLEIIVCDGNTTTNRLLADFEDERLDAWHAPATAVRLQMDLRFSGVGSRFGYLDCAQEDFMQTVVAFQDAAGITATRIGDQPNKTSDRIRESYLFLTSFSAAQFEEAMAIVRRGGFKHVLLGEESWCESTGHYGVSKKNFPGGLPQLIDTVQRFKAEGVTVGFHVLAASISYKDAYITPVPDPRLYNDVHTTLAAELNETTTTIYITDTPKHFPEEDGSYMGRGRVLQIGHELITYTTRTLTTPFAFEGCTRGHLGTRPASHTAGARVSHLARTYGYHYFDADTTLLDEVATNFAHVANACDIDMVYFDGMERMQEPHARYNARLITAFSEKLNRKDILIQASSFSHFSWQKLGRSASADGHGDLKGYLEERAPSFTSFKKLHMPLDIGWYYGYDVNATPDQFEYILGTTIGYDSSMSFQVSVPAAARHPWTGEILDLIKRYEQLRLSGDIDDSIREKLRVPKELAGRAPEDTSRPTHLRRDYRLEETTAGQVLQRVEYGEWHNLDGLGANGYTFTIAATSATRALEFQVHNQSAAETSATALINPRFVLDSNPQPWQYSGPVSYGEYLDYRTGAAPSLHTATVARRGAAGNALIAKPNGDTTTIRFLTDEPTTATIRLRANKILPEQLPLNQ